MCAQCEQMSHSVYTAEGGADSRVPEWRAQSRGNEAAHFHREHLLRSIRRDHQGRVHLDRRHGADRSAPVEDQGSVEPEAELPIWGFDGSSTNQAPGKASDCVLKPVFTCPDPIRGGDNVLVMCEVLLTDMTPHPTNTRAALVEVATSTPTRSPFSGIEQEYTMFKGSRPLGFPDSAGYPVPRAPTTAASAPTTSTVDRLVEAHLDACLEAGLAISGINAEVMPGQWEFQVGPVGPLEVSDQLWMARWLLHRIGEDFGHLGDPRPQAGARRLERRRRHTNFSTKAMRESYDAVISAAEALGPKTEEHVRQLRPRHRGPPYRPARDRPLQRVQLRRVRPGSIRADPLAGRKGRARATSRIAAPTPTWTHTRSPG